MRGNSNRVRLAVVAIALTVAAPALALSTYFTAQCASCHSPAVVGSTATTCNGCHAHGSHPSSAKSSINVAGVTNATSYTPGQTVSVTITGGYRTGWIRAVLFDQNMNQLAISTGPNGMGGGAGYPITLTAPAPTVAGSYTWNVAWYGNKYDAGGAAFGARFMDDPNNPDHGYEVVSTNVFTVASPTSPAITLAPASLDFGTVTMGSSATLPTQVRNTGTANLSVTGIALCTSPITEPEYSWTAPALPFTVAPGGSATINVTFTPADPDTDTGCITFTSNAANAPIANLAVTAIGVAPPTPVASVSPLALDFGAVTDGSSATRTLTVGNVGTAALIVAITRATGTSAEFGATPVSFTVQPGGSATVIVTYAPIDVGMDAGTLQVATNDPVQGTIPVSLAGSGVAAPTPHLALSPASLDLGGVTVGGSTSLPVQVANTGTGPLQVTSIAPCAGTSAEFGWSPAAPFTVAAGGATTLNVRYTPTGAGSDTGCLAIGSNDPGSPVTSLPVQGTGIAPAAPVVGVAPASLAFGAVTVGLSIDRTFTVSNSGNATLTGTVARAAGNSAEFTPAPATLTVPPGGSQVVTVTYAPSGPGADAGNVVVATNDPATPSVQVSLSGSGVSAPAPAIALVPPALAFGPLTTGSTASLATAVTNQGSATLDVSSITGCSGTSAEFSWSPSGPLQVAPGTSVTLNVTYAPTDLGADTGCLAVASDDPANPVVNLALSGSGVAQASPVIALAPASLDFGIVTVGASAMRTSQVRNIGTATLHVSSIVSCGGTSPEFTWAPVGPFDVSPGGATTLTVSYGPIDAGTDTGCLQVASDDPGSPVATLAVTGAGAQPTTNVGDVDIDELEVPEELLTWTDRTVVPRAELRNRSSVAAQATARLTAALGSATLYDQTIPVNIRAREDEDFTFPPLVVAKGTSGPIRWTLQVDDADPDVDLATARTFAKASHSGGDDSRFGGAAELSVAAVTSQAPAGGCSAGGPSTSLGLLLALGALALVPRRRRP